MLLKVFKLWVLGAVLFFASQQAQAGIPVYCYNCQEGSSNAGHAILDGIRNQTEAILNAWGYAVKADAKVGLSKDVAIFKTERAIENAKAFEPSLAKPDTACTTYNSSSMRNAVSNSGGGKVTQALIGIAKGHNQSASQLSETEPKREYFAAKVLERLELDNKDTSIGGAKVLLSEPFSEDKLAGKLEEVAFLTNPFPIETPSVESMKLIKSKGSTGDKDSMARVLVTNDRIEAAQTIILDEVKNDAQLYDGSSLKEYVKQVGASLSKEQKAVLKGKLSANQIDELLATYRVRSPKWVAKTMTLSEVGVIREQALIQAEMLNQLWEVKSLLKTMKVMQAYSDVRDTVQSGPTKQ